MTNNKQTLQQKQDEKARLLKSYRAIKRKEWADLIAREPRMVAFRKWMRRQTDAPTALIVIADSWIRHSHLDFRYAALNLIEKQAGKMAEYQGREALDDPIPPKTNFYFTVREMFNVR